MSMTKSDITDQIYKKIGLSKKEASDLVDIVFKIMKDTLSHGEKVKISGFGNFVIRDKQDRIGRNPQTGKTMQIPGRRVIVFKPSQVLKDDITSKYAHRIDDKGEEDLSQPPEKGTSRALKSFSNSHDENVA